MWALFKETFWQWLEDNPSQLGAALAYYAIFAIAPLLVMCVLPGKTWGSGPP